MPLLPVELTRSAIYNLRNLLDMAVSFAHHYGLSKDKTADVIGNPARLIHGHEHDSKTFFRSGRSGDGQKYLPQSVIDKIIADHGDVMENLIISFNAVRNFS